MAQIPDHIIDRIRETVDIVELISRYINLKKQGKNFKALCPFHTEKTPSFTVNADKQIFYCFGCGAGGNVFNFLMRYEKITFLEAIQKLSAETGIELPKFREDERKLSEYDQLYRAYQFACDFYHNLLHSKYSQIEPYLKKRQIDPETIKFFKIGYVPDEWDTLYQEILRKKMDLEPFQKAGLILESEKDRQKKYDRFRNRLMFPILNLSGRIIAFGGRDLGGTTETPKYINSPESAVYIKSQVLYGLYFAKEWIRQEGFVIMVEGYMDHLQLFQNDIKNVVATSGTALTSEHAKLIRRYTKEIVLCYDADAAGIQAAVRGGQILFQDNLNVRVIILPENEDPDSFLRKNNKSEFYALLKTARDYFDFRIEQLQKTIGMQDVSQKSKIVEDLIDCLGGHSDPLKQNFYGNIIAEKFNLQESTITEEIRRKSKQIKSREMRYQDNEPDRKAQEKPSLSLVGAWSAEKDLLLILLNHLDEVKNVIFQLVEEQDFLNKEFRHIFTLVKENSSKSKDELTHWLFSILEDERIVSLLTAELFKEISKPERYLNDCILKIKVTRYQTEIDTIKQQLKQLNPSQPEYQAHLHQINSNLSKIHEIRKIFTRK
ncbi:MAG: DNA primase [Caldithrix sp. RBG_13_44_9]|nr:MAG: DNA primase [Caldithrix sp. RBG_13_44_9]